MSMRNRTKLTQNRRYRHFDWAWVPPDSTIVIFAPRNSGKSNLLLDIERVIHLNRSAIICPSPEIHFKYKSWPYCYRHAEFDPEWLENLMKDQDRYAQRIALVTEEYAENMEKEAKGVKEKEEEALKQQLIQESEREKWNEKKLEKEAKRRMEEFEIRWQDKRKERVRNYKALEKRMRLPFCASITFDDCGSDSSMMKHKLVRTILNNGRHYMLLAIFLIQYMMNFPADIRGGIDYVVIFGEKIQTNIKRLHDHYSCALSLGEFTEVLKDMTKNYGCMVIDARAQSTRPEDYIFYYKSDNMDYTTIAVGDEHYRRWAEKWSKTPPHVKKKRGTKTEDEEDESKEAAQIADRNTWKQQKQGKEIESMSGNVLKSMLLAARKERDGTDEEEEPSGPGAAKKDPLLSRLG